MYVKHNSGPSSAAYRAVRIVPSPRSVRARRSTGGPCGGSCGAGRKQRGRSGAARQHAVLRRRRRIVQPVRRAAQRGDEGPRQSPRGGAHQSGHSARSRVCAMRSGNAIA
eukprot:Selendium_serpulae@DN4665_c0_g1_i2.p3